ncbi:hypothetical protein AVEN_166360-1 [Araneus ventricosus]|uniref:Uncharacterized protein n=1 Tax=Araneus ventricosus TaxID=182803 RepID=A0A4Y2IBB3_ARAVE|nr:hypothetical protein AVEN_166360-1 [Araneus ventricosus]
MKVLQSNRGKCLEILRDSYQKEKRLVKSPLRDKAHKSRFPSFCCYYPLLLAPYEGKVDKEDPVRVKEVKIRFPVSAAIITFMMELVEKDNNSRNFGNGIFDFLLCGWGQIDPCVY